MTCRLLIAPLLLTALLCVPAVAYAAQDAVTWQCTPAEGETVFPGDTITYSITAEQAGATGDWTAFRVQLGEGMRFLPESVQILPAQTEEDAVAADVEPADDAGEEAPEADQAETIRDVVPGNDGFVVLLSKLNAGDTFAFSAVVETENSTVSAQVETDAFTSDVSHVLGVLPVQEAAAPDVPPEGMQEANGPPKALLWMFVQLCTAGLGFIVYVICRKWGKSILPLLHKCIAKVQQFVKALLQANKKPTSTEQASLAQQAAEDQNNTERRLTEQCTGVARE